MNVLYLVSELVPSGPINQALNIVTGFDKKEVNATIVTLFDEREQSWMDKYVSRGVKVIQLHSNRKKLFSAKKQLIAIIKENHIDVVHSSGFSADLVNSMLENHVLTVSTFRSHISDICERSNFLVRIVSRTLFRYSLNRIGILVGCSNALAKDMQEDIHKKCRVVQNGADIDHYTVLAKGPKQELRRQLGLPAEKKIFVSVGALEPRKNMALIIRAFNKIRSNEVCLVIVGEGEEMGMLQGLIGDNKRIILTGSVLEPLPYYQSADYFVSASLAEGLPNTVLEAMSCGLPSLLSDIGPHAEMLAYDENAGCIFNRYDEADLAQIIMNALDWDMDKKSLQARQLIENNLSKYCMAGNYLAIYKEGLSAVKKK